MITLPSKLSLSLYNKNNDKKITIVYDNIMFALLLFIMHNFVNNRFGYAYALL